jgi:hypothetical protein
MTRRQEKELRTPFDPSRERFQEPQWPPPSFPTGQYEVIGIPREQLRAGDHRLERDRRTFLETQSGSALQLQEGLRQRSARANLELFVRPVQPTETTSIAFRGATREQVEAVFRARLGPDWLVEVAPNRFDLTIRFPVRLTEAEERVLRHEIADRFGLTKPEGAFLNAVHLPTLEAAHLFRTNLAPAPATFPLLDRHRVREAHAEVSRLASVLEAPGSLPPRAGTLVSALAGERLGQARNPYDEIQLRIQAVRAVAQREAPSASQPLEPALIERAREIQSSLFKSEALEPARMTLLVNLEGRIAQRTHGAQAEYLEALGASRLAVDRLEGATKAAQTRAASPETLRVHHQALAAYEHAEGRLVDAAERYAAWRGAQLGLDALRSAGSLEQSPCFAAQFRLVGLLDLEHIALRLAGQAPAAPLPSPSSIEGAEARVREYREGLMATALMLDAGARPDVAAVRHNAQQLFQATQALQNVRLAQPPQARGPAADQGQWVSRADRIEAYLERRRGQAAASYLQADTRPFGFLHRETLPQALERLVHQGPSPEILRQIHRLLSHEHQLGPGPAWRESGAFSVGSWIERSRALGQEVVTSARAALDAGAKAPGELWKQLHAQATEALALSRALDRQERTWFALPDPRPTASHHKPAAWGTAWAFFARERGQEAVLIASHLGNLTASASVASSFRAGGEAVELTRLARSAAVGFELTQGLPPLRFPR